MFFIRTQIHITPIPVKQLSSNGALVDILGNIIQHIQKYLFIYLSNVEAVHPPHRRSMKVLSLLWCMETSGKQDREICLGSLETDLSNKKHDLGVFHVTNHVLIALESDAFRQNRVLCIYFRFPLSPQRELHWPPLRSWYCTLYPCTSLSQWGSCQLTFREVGPRAENTKRVGVSGTFRSCILESEADRK